MRQRELVTAVALLATLAGAAGAQGKQRLVVTPTTRTIVAGDTIRFSAQLLDEAGKPVPNSRVVFRNAGGYFEGKVDSTGKLSAGSVGTMPITAIGIVPGEKPVVERFEVAMVPGPAARVAVAPRPARLAVGQRVHLAATVYSKADDRRNDRVQWSSDKPAVAPSDVGTRSMPSSHARRYA